MDTLLIRLIGPQQAWGVQSAGDDRDTGREPSKSGVIGLICAALGRPRWAPLDDLAALRMGVRVDREGTLERDFQTIHRISWEGKSSPGSISNRYYLTGAAFLVGLEGPLGLLERLQAGLENPRWLLYLGRKAFPPSLPVALPDGLRQGQALEEALLGYPWLLGSLMPSQMGVPFFNVPREAPKTLRLTLEDPQGEIGVMDQPISFAERRFAHRRFRMERIALAALPAATQEA
jgi:CRISPR system Cascade subunit CasD